jgi:23S rRNA (cytosine1962-C5)-methyltransferase
MDYQLLDSGENEKLERFGAYVLRRPDPQALWERGQAPAVWDAADAWFERRGDKGEWRTRTDLPPEWEIEYGGLQFVIRPTSFKHVGLFPEQIENWKWIEEVIVGKPSVLNLFGYTGGASLIAAKAGASVTHIDASKTAVEWARLNATKSGLADAPIRWIVEDAMKFVDRDLKRGTKYDGIILDPPAFGHGPDKELWKIEEDLVPLMKKCRDLLTEKPQFVLMNGYAAGYSRLAFEHLLEPIQKVHGGTVDSGELTIQESKSGRLMPAGIYAKWRVATP